MIERGPALAAKKAALEKASADLAFAQQTLDAMLARYEVDPTYENKLAWWAAKRLFDDAVAQGKEWVI